MRPHVLRQVVWSRERLAACVAPDAARCATATSRLLEQASPRVRARKRRVKRVPFVHPDEDGSVGGEEEVAFVLQHKVLHLPNIRVLLPDKQRQHHTSHTHFTTCCSPRRPLRRDVSGSIRSSPAPPNKNTYRFSLSTKSQNHRHTQRNLSLRSHPQL